MKNIDLHVHSNLSDGTFSPAKLVEYASQKGLYAFALTDHDTTDGIAQAEQTARTLREQGVCAPKIIAGIEFSTRYEKQDVHIVGLDMDYRQPYFKEQLYRFQNARDIRNRKMIQKLQDGGIDISYEQMLAAFGEAVWTRAHFARYLKDIGLVSTMPEAFANYVGEHCPYYVPREMVTPVQAVSLIRQTGGIAVLAHPLLYGFSEETLDTLIISLKEAGLIGIEVLYSTHTPQQEAYVQRLAKHYDLAPSGGSDFHGSNKPDIDLGCGRGNLAVPLAIWEGLCKRRTQHG